MTDRTLLPVKRIERAILIIRGHKVILDASLAELYGVETKALVRAVPGRFHVAVLRERV